VTQKRAVQFTRRGETVLDEAAIEQQGIKVVEHGMARPASGQTDAPGEPGIEPAPVDQAGHEALSGVVVEKAAGQVGESAADDRLDIDDHLLPGPVEDDDDLAQVIELLPGEAGDVAGDHVGQFADAAEDDGVAGGRRGKRLPGDQRRDELSQDSAGDSLGDVLTATAVLTLHVSLPSTSASEQ
jgi:hypothetical protein